MTLLTVVQDAARRCKIPPPDIVVAGTTDLDAQLMWGFANEAGKRLMRRHNWQELETEKTITTVAQSLQTSAIPTDFDRMVEGSFYNRSGSRRLVGPLNAQRWQQLQATASASVWHAFRIRLGELYVFPTPTAGETWAYEYISNKWVLASGDTTPTKAAFSVDTDTSVFDEEMLTLEIVWRWKAHKGHTYDEDFRKAEETIEDRIANDKVMSALNMDDLTLDGGVSDPSIPDGSWTL